MRKRYKLILFLAAFGILSVFFLDNIEKSDVGVSNFYEIDEVNGDATNTIGEVSDYEQSESLTDGLLREDEFSEITEREFSRIFVESFDKEGLLEESGTISESTNLKWSVSSGAFLYFKKGVGSTVLGDLNDNVWAPYYKEVNSVDSDGGIHPQNIFRLVQRDRWTNYEQSVYFRIVNNNFSSSPQRNSSNGLLLFNRYQNSDNLYYVGLRVDGAVTIKKKSKGAYSDLYYVKGIFKEEYNREENVSLLPVGTWIGLKNVIQNNSDDQVKIEVYTDIGRTGEWKLVAEATDTGEGSVRAFIGSGNAGIRTDFMDVEFDDYSIREYKN